MTRLYVIRRFVAGSHDYGCARCAKGLGKATFKYEYNITVRKNEKGVGVRATVPFWEEKMFIAEKQKNLPEGTNMMRHILYRNLVQKAKPLVAKMPDRPDQDVRYAPSDNLPAPVAQVQKRQ